MRVVQGETREVYNARERETKDKVRKIYKSRKEMIQKGKR